ncbi:MAG: FAD-dependent oxidoreductase [Pseudomonadota bacterium]
MTKDQNILIIGGGFAGARAAQDLVKSGFSNVSLIDRKDYFEVTYSTLRTLANPGFGERGRMRYSDFIKGGFKQGDVTQLSKNAAKLADGSEVAFDTAIVATGSSYSSFPVAKSAEALSLDARAAEMSSEHDKLAAANTVLIVGGGAVGVELAGEIADHFPNKTVTLAEAGDRILSDLKPKASATAQSQLESLGVRVLTGSKLTPDDDAYKEADLVYMCVGLTPNTELMKAEFASSLAPSGRIMVDDQFRVAGAETIYAMGDCASTPDVKFGYVADAQGALLAKNIAAASAGKSTKDFKAQPVMSLIPVGRRRGVAQMPFGVTTLGFFVNMKQKDMFVSRQFANLGVKVK